MTGEPTITETLVGILTDEKKVEIEFDVFYRKLNKKKLVVSSPSTVEK